MTDGRELLLATIQVLRLIQAERSDIKKLFQSFILFPSTTTFSSQNNKAARINSVDALNFDLSNVEYTKKKDLQESPVPSSRINRIFNYSTLAAKIGINMFTASVKDTFNRTSHQPSSSSASAFFSARNTEAIVATLSRMRGASLKIGQMLSIQDDSGTYPPTVQEIFSRVRDSANYMPLWQMNRVMSDEIGDDWKSRIFKEFNDIPIAAASIGQVHKAVLHDGTVVAVKIQYPGIKESIQSDLDNLRSLLLFSKILPKGLFIDNTIRVARQELALETDYCREAQFMTRFANLLNNQSIFYVPKVYENSTRHILITEFCNGMPIDKAASSLSQDARDLIGTQILSLCLREIFEYQAMQTDPNWSNFLIDPLKRKIILLDFGAAREFNAEFTYGYWKIIDAAVKMDYVECRDWSRKLGFLTGHESRLMEEAHVHSVFDLAEPFRHSEGLCYQFINNGASTAQVKSRIPTMLHHRLTPPPDESYSLHRKLSGCLLLCMKLQARVDCRTLFQDISKIVVSKHYALDEHNKISS